LRFNQAQGRLALAKGAAVMVTSHLGRPKEGVFDKKDSLAPVARRLSELLDLGVPSWHGSPRSGQGQ